jgi:potassium/chloride transporter 9
MEIDLPGLPNSNITGRFTGLSSQTFTDNLYSNYTVDYTTEKATNFSFIFGVLFSSLTGIMAGANMSGELKKPSKSIPTGTIGAVIFVFTLYITESLLLAASCDHNLLVYNNKVLQEISFWGPLVPIGIIASTFSSELSCIIGSSRILKALADDEIFGSALNFVKFGKTKAGNPIVAVICSFVIAQLVLLIGSLNAIAPLVTILYLLAYFGVNLACLALGLASAPNFRPTFKYFSWHTALFGMVSSITMTFIVSIEYAAISIGMLVAIVTMLYLRDFPPEWGSISQALIFHQVRKYLLMLDTRKDHVKFWRPQILLLISNPRSALSLIEFGNDVKKGGLFVLGNVKVGDLSSHDEDPCAKELPLWTKLVENLKVKAFVELTLSPSIKNGIQNLIRVSGLGGMKPNTVMMGFYDNVMPEDLLKSRSFAKKKRLLNYSTNSIDSIAAADRFMSQFEELRVQTETLNTPPENRLDLDSYVECIRDILKMKKNLCIARQFNLLKKDEIKRKTNQIFIDVWPINFLLPETCAQLDSTCLFMFQLSCILNMVSVWKKATLRVFLCSDNLDVIENARRKSRLDNLLNQLRIKAFTCVVPIDNIKHLLNRPVIPEGDLYHFQHLPTSVQVLNVSQVYLKTVNALLKTHSDNSTLCFLYLPAPPAIRQQVENAAAASSDDLMNPRDNNKKYISILETLSDSLPPCIFVNGVNVVTSTTL